MKYIILGIILTIILVFLLVYPFKIVIYNKSNYLHIDISNFLTLRLNLLAILDNAKSDDIKNSSKNIKLMKKIKIKKIDIKLKGLNFDYRMNGAYFGAICALGGIGKKIFADKDIEFNCDFQYLGDKSIEFESIIRARAIKIIGIINNV